MNLIKYCCVISILALVLVINTVSLFAAGKTWTGTTDSNWAEASNWNPSGVPTASDDVSIPANLSIYPIIKSGTNALALSVGLGYSSNDNLSQLDIENGGSLLIEEFSYYGIINSGIINNNGIIKIQSSTATPGRGISNSKIFNNSIEGEIIINDTDSDGISNGLHGVFTNAGKINIGNLVTIGGVGLINSASFENTIDGEININRTGEEGLYHALLDDFTNAGKINIGNLESIGNIGLHIIAPFENTKDGEITINRTNEEGIRLALSNDFINSGKIDIGNLGTIGGIGFYLTAAPFENTKDSEMTINRTGGSGIVNATSNNFTNSGKINIGNLGAIEGKGIEGSSDFTNTKDGTITIDNTTSHGIETSYNTFTNAGKIDIGGIADIGFYGISNGGTFNNNTEGEINIDRTANDGISNYNGIFTNSSIINIGQTANVGYYGIFNQNYFYNNTGGIINIDRTDNMGMRNSGTFTNSSTINIGQVVGVGGYGLYTYNTFYNNVGGEINIEKTTYYSLFNSLDTFHNFATINIGQTVGIGIYGMINIATFNNYTGGEININEGIENIDGGNFTNHPCATIRATKKIDNGLTSTFDNKGFLYSSFEGTHINTGTFYNQGTIEDKHNAFDGITFTNGNLRIIPISNCNSNTISDAIEDNDKGTFTVGANWYLDESLTELAGTYNQTSNVFTLDLLLGEYTLYMLVTDIMMGCSEVMSISVKGGEPIITGDLEYCALDGSTTLQTGTYNSYLWSNGETSQNIEASEGTYTVTVTNSNNCTGTNKVTIVENENPSPSISGNLEYCASENFTTLDAGTWTSYLWSNSEENQKIEASEGSYTVTVTNSNGCTGTDEVTVIENENPIPSITGDLEYCTSNNATILDAGNWKNYLWSNEETSQIIEVTAGTYTVTVTNSNSCTGTDEVTVIENENPAPRITGTFDYCRGREATLDAGVWSSYAWSNGETVQFFSTTSIGIYTVTVTNSNDCTGTAMAEITAIPCLAEAGILTTNASTICAGEAIEVSSTEEQKDDNYLQYSFLYTQDNLGNTIFHQGTETDYETGNASANFDGLESGNYLVCVYNEYQNCPPNPSPITTNLDDIYQTGTVQDGCFDIECTQINVPETFAPNIEGSGQVTGTNASGHNIFIAEVCGGTAPYSMEFDFTNGFVNVQEYPSENVGCINYQVVYTQGTDWTLTITDANNCSNEAVVFGSTGLPSTPLPQILYYSSTPETCIGDLDGIISLEVEGGDGTCGDYTYTWSSTNGFGSTVTDEPTGTTLSGLASGFYDVTVTDCAGTTTTQDIYVNRTNSSGGRGRGRSGCKTGGDTMSENNTLFVSPNPFNKQTSIEFSLIETSKVWLSVYSMDGRKVAELLQGETIEGEIWQQKIFEVGSLQSGVYILELQTELGLRQHKQLMVVK